MCYPKPGPRCSAHTHKAVVKAEAVYLDDPTGENYGRLQAAWTEYHMTPRGIADLKADGHAELAERYQDLREFTMQEWKESLRKESAFADYRENKSQPAYAFAENHVVELMQPGATFSMDGVEYISLASAKPQSSGRGGEGKTDIYVLVASETGERKEIKISYKKDNADSYENWMSASRAEAVFGSEWQSVLSKSLESSRTMFESTPTYARGPQKAQVGGIYTLGYAIDLRSKPRALSTKLDFLTKQQEVEIYAGTHLPEGKRNSFVNGQTIANSGVASHMLVKDPQELNSAQDVVNSLVTIDDYVDDHRGQLYLAYKAVNYRAAEHKAEQSRPLVVSVDWAFNTEINRFEGKYNFNTPLSISSTDATRTLVDEFNHQKDDSSTRNS